ncbi:MAG TPA: hypothetical protein VFC85_03250, partial [Verrucomicrobiae bacterium]|nr:hypothetical protein [Verrucomicrobiae bacterium]
DSDNGGLHNEMKTLTICIFTTHDAANIARSNLEAHGIECWVSADDCGGMYPNLTAPGGVRLSVRASDAEAAIALLNAEASPAEINQIETEAVASAPPETGPLKKLAWIQILVGVVTGVILCLLYQSASNFGAKTYYHHVHGKVNKKWIYRNGYEAEFSEDRNLDGVMDHWVQYDEYGQVSSSEYDNNFDGKTDETWTYSNGSLVTMQKDTDFNGVSDEFCTYKYGIIQWADMKPNGSKFVTEREIFQNGVLTEILRGGDSNGNFKEDVHYDPFFNPVPINFNPISTNAPTTFQLLSPSK